MRPSIPRGQVGVDRELILHPRNSLGNDLTHFSEDAAAVLKTDHRFVIAGFSDGEASRNQVLMNEYAGVAVFSIDRLLRRGVNVASVLMRGGEVADRVEIEIPVVESSEKAALPRMRVDPPQKPPMLSPKLPAPAPASAPAPE